MRQSGLEAAEYHTCFCGKGNDGPFVHKGVRSAVRRVDLDAMQPIGVILLF
jgi:hypothetical protein